MSIESAAESILAVLHDHLTGWRVSDERLCCIACDCEGPRVPFYAGYNVLDPDAHRPDCDVGKAFWAVDELVRAARDRQG